MIYLISFAIIILFVLNYFRDKRISNPEKIRKELIDFIINKKSYNLEGPLSFPSMNSLASFSVNDIDNLFFHFTPHTEWYREFRETSSWNYKPPSPTDLYNVFYKDNSKIHHAILQNIKDEEEEFILFILSIYIGNNEHGQKFKVKQGDIIDNIIPLLDNQNWKVRKLALMSIFLYHNSEREKNSLINDCIDDKSKNVRNLVKTLQEEVKLREDIENARETIKADNIISELPVRPVYFHSEEEKINYEKEIKIWLNKNKEELKIKGVEELRGNTKDQ